MTRGPEVLRALFAPTGLPSLGFEVPEHPPSVGDLAFDV
jgi:hypothetical protein